LPAITDRERPKRAALLQPGPPVQPEAISTDFTETYPESPSSPFAL